MNPSAGRGILIFAGLMLALGLFTGVARGAWIDAALWIAVAAFLGSYAAITLDWLPRWRRLLLAAGLLAGLAAFGLAIWSMLGR